MQRLLVIDDDRDIRMVLGAFLSRQGYSVRFAANGSEALFILDKQLVDLILLDVVMPQLDAAGFIEALRKKPGRCDIPLIIVSGYDRFEAAERLGPQWRGDFLQKNAMDFFQKLNELVQKNLQRSGCAQGATSG